MKKLISILLLICTITICLSSCGDNNKDDTNPSETPNKNPSEQENHTPYDAFVFYPQSSDTYVVGIAPGGKYYTEIVIPSTYNGGKVVGIVKEGFKDCENLVSIKIPNTVIEIKESAFYNCKNLKTIEFSNSIKTIEEDAFTNCGNKESVYFNGTIQDWCNITFSGRLSTSSVSPDHVLESNPLCYGTDLYIKGELFTTLNTADIPTLSGREIAYYFSFCTSLETVIISESVIYELSFIGCTSLKNVTIPNGVTKIEYGAFEQCQSLRSITIPNSVVTIEDYAFGFCFNLNTITFDGSKSEWDAIQKGNKWNSLVDNCSITYTK